MFPHLVSRLPSYAVSVFVNNSNNVFDLNLTNLLTQYLPNSNVEDVYRHNFLECVCVGGALARKRQVCRSVGATLPNNVQLGKHRLEIGSLGLPLRRHPALAWPQCRHCAALAYGVE